MQLVRLPASFVLLGWLMALSSVGHAQIILDRPKATPTPAKPRVVEKKVYLPTPRTTNSPASAAAYATLLVTTDLRVRISVNGGPAVTLAPEEIKKVGLEQGTNLIRVTPLDGGSDGFTDQITARERGNSPYNIDLGSRRQAQRERVEADRQLQREREEAERQAKVEAVRQAQLEGQRQAQFEKERLKRLPKVLEEIARQLVPVAGGTFKMGIKDHWTGIPSSAPIHSVTLSSFSISKYEVTQLQWETIMGKNPSRFKDCPTCPVENVNWDDVQAFLTRLNQLSGKQYRLPTEAQWEYAARGGQQSRKKRYAGSGSLDAVAWYEDNSDDRTHPVGQKQPNELGLYDMSGNVYELCQDWWSDDYYRQSPNTDPPGPDSGKFHIERGGGYFMTDYGCELWQRGIAQGISFGFRIASQAQ